MNKEAIKLKKLLGDAYNVLKGQEICLAGGAITSLFTNKEINDYDIYFKSQRAFKQFLLDLVDYGYTYGYRFHSNKSVLFEINGLKLQLILVDWYPTVKDIFDHFDFTINMGAFDFETEQFVLHDDFLRHNSERTLSFNTGTKFPIVSAFRIQKYVERGYTISKADFMKVMLTVNQLNLTSYDDVAEHIGGMYGLQPDQVFDKTQTFSLDDCIVQLEDIYTKDFTKWEVNLQTFNFFNFLKHFEQKVEPNFAERVNTMQSLGYYSYGRAHHKSNNTIFW